MILGCIIIYGILFAIGNYLYGKMNSSIIFMAITVISTFVFIPLWKRLTTLNN